MTTPALRPLSALLALTLLATPLHAQDQAVVPPTGGASDAGELPLDELRTFADVFNQIRLSYVEEVDDKTLLESAIRGMLEGLDPHSAYLDADSFDDLQVNTSGEFGGLGLEVGMEDGFIKVIAPIDGTPAQRAGIEPGDIIVKLDGKPVKGLSLTDAVDAMRGEAGSKVDLTILREGNPKPLEIELERAVIKVVSVRSRLLEPGFGYLRIAQFQAGTGEEFSRELNKLLADGKLKGLVLDLRNNPGGILQSSVEVADAFLDNGLIVYTEGRLPTSRSQFSASGADLTDGTPMVVLINGGSASAAEIVAGALQDHRRAVIMGTDSFGKGSVQTVVPLSEQSAIKLTTARYFTPDGRSIQANGIAPDIQVDRARLERVESNEITEADLQRHLSSGNGKESTAKSRRQQQKQEELLTSDNQLYEALTLLKGLHILGRNSGTAAVPTT